MSEVIIGQGYRITVLTARLLRLEYQKDNRFLDEKTQVVQNRDFPETACSVEKEGNGLTLETEALFLRYDGEPFSSNGFSIFLKEMGTTWHYSIVYGNSDRNYFGTARTLDETDGYTKLESGLFGEYGYAVLDDSHSAVLTEGEFQNRAVAEMDLYFFGYGRDFYGGLKDFYHLCGKTPLIPRYALGNWWSRYFRYTEESYRELLSRFEEEEIPLSVAVVDMDWHLTEVDEKYGTGWTGYTWDSECFPDYRRFLSFLKEKHLAVTLNLHPADGIRGYEEMYERVARRMGIDPETEQAVEFDFSDPKFRQVYFEEVMHPYEEAGVDFWWIDWQQGTGRKEGEIDPLLLLNHFHYHDQEGRGVRPMIFSRYAGPGSHRYPIGFSGDTHASWRTLDFQPFFTATASNIGYGFWSHDIGGHMCGDKNDERLIRWIQYGVFSPIMRIHSSNSPFFNKEPWQLDEPYHRIMASFLRLRHRLLPYLYTASYEAAEKDLPMIQPMYYRYPEEREAYEVGNEYLFGSTLLVSPITEPADAELRMASVNTWIPEGRWYDIFTGRIYDGSRKRKLYRTLDSIPVLLPEGGIVPESLSDRENGTGNPRALRILFGAGKGNEYILYEDDGCSMDYQNGAFVRTRIALEWGEGECKLIIEPAEGEFSLIPEKRSYEFRLYGAYGAVADGSYEAYQEKGYLRIEIPETAVTERTEVKLRDLKPLQNDRKQEVFELLERAWISTITKEMVLREADAEDFPERLAGLPVPEKLKDAIREVL